MFLHLPYSSRGHLLASEYVAIYISSLFYSIYLGLQLEQESFLQTFSTLGQKSPGRQVNENQVCMLIWYVQTGSVVYNYHLKRWQINRRTKCVSRKFFSYQRKTIYEVK